MNDEGNVWEGRSERNFAEAGYNAVAAAEQDRGDDAPLEYDVTFRAKRSPDSSLSEYIAVARGRD
jgi:hypothetical protein